MLVEAFFNLLKGVFEAIMGMLPTLDGITIPSGFITWFTNIMNASSFFLPLADFLIMFGIWMAVTNFDIIWKIIMRIWDALPFT